MEILEENIDNHNCVPYFEISFGLINLFESLGMVQTFDKIRSKLDVTVLLVNNFVEKLHYFVIKMVEISCFL